jgi:hypothetical protein
MPRTTRQLVAALTFVTLSLSPLESFAGPLQVAVHKYPPDWLTRTGHGPRQTQLGMSCAGKLLTGLGIGAGIGVGLLTLMVPRGDISHEAALGVPLVFGVMGTAVAYKSCR